MSFPEFIIGIDLGTTNSVVSYAREGCSIQVFAIPQLTGPGTIEKQDILPSAVLIPGENDTPFQALVLPWDTHATQAIGEFARNRGAEIPHRLIASAKSWLCHALVDRNKPILPWEGPDSRLKLSPVAASAAILRHIRDAWDHEMARTPSGFDDHLRMENQEILLTVPASFDAIARELTVKAAQMAGLNHVTLLEEPQAAFYAWIEASGDNWRRNVEKGDLILVCDIGGGTTDFSLIAVSEQNGELALERIAVGNHLLVGGDNMDLVPGLYRIAENGRKRNPPGYLADARAVPYLPKRQRNDIVRQSVRRLPHHLAGKGQQPDWRNAENPAFGRGCIPGSAGGISAELRAVRSACKAAGHGNSGNRSFL